MLDNTIVDKATELFDGDLNAVTRWLNTPNKALKNQTPLVYSGTESGAREIENLIGRIEHGVFS